MQRYNTYCEYCDHNYASSWYLNNKHIFTKKHESNRFYAKYREQEEIRRKEEKLKEEIRKRDKENKKKEEELKKNNENLFQERMNKWREQNELYNRKIIYESINLFIENLKKKSNLKNFNNKNSKINAKLFINNPQIFINIGEKCFEEIKNYPNSDLLNIKKRKIKKYLQESKYNDNNYEKFISIRKFVQQFCGIKDSNVDIKHDIKLQEIAKFFCGFLELIRQINKLLKTQYDN